MATVSVSVATMSRAIRRLGITLKKVLHAAERDPVRRAAWWEALDEVDPTALVFVDETGTNLAMTPRYGRAPRGERVVGTVPRNHGPNTTLVAALSLDGITAAMTREGAIDRCAFDAFVDQVLAPRLKPGQVVVWDNLSVHKSADAQRRIEARGCQLLWLPPYSPDFTPIEEAFSTLKTALRRSGARTREALDDAITAALTTITAADTPGWFAHCGYPIPAQLIGEPL
jgi:transposase